MTSPPLILAGFKKELTVIIPMSLPGIGFAACCPCSRETSRGSLETGVRKSCPNAMWLAAKWLCLRGYDREGFRGFSERSRQASITVDIGKFSARAIERQLFPSARSLSASSSRKPPLLA